MIIITRSLEIISCMRAMRNHWSISIFLGTISDYSKRHILTRFHVETSPSDGIMGYNINQKHGDTYFAGIRAMKKHSSISLIFGTKSECSKSYILTKYHWDIFLTNQYNIHNYGIKLNGSTKIPISGIWELWELMKRIYPFLIQSHSLLYLP